MTSTSLHHFLTERHDLIRFLKWVQIGMVHGAWKHIPQMMVILNEVEEKVQEIA